MKITQIKTVIRDLYISVKKIMSACMVGIEIPKALKSRQIGRFSLNRYDYGYDT
jgi:hypothetical protein